MQQRRRSRTKLFGTLMFATEHEWKSHNPSCLRSSGQRSRRGSRRVGDQGSQEQKVFANRDRDHLREMLSRGVTQKQRPHGGHWWLSQRESLRSSSRTGSPQRQVRESVQDSEGRKQH